MDSLRSSIWKSKVNSLLGIVFVGTFSLGALLIVWQAAFGQNPVANTLAGEISAETQLPN